MKNHTLFSPPLLPFIIFIGVFLLSSCDEDKNAEIDPINSQISLKTADSSENFETEIKNYLYLGIKNQNLLRNENFDSSATDESKNTSATPADGTVADTSEASASGGNAGSSSTNLVEQGVDEADLIKTDGIHLFIAQQAKIDYKYNDDIIESEEIILDSGETSTIASSSSDENSSTVLSSLPIEIGEPVIIEPAKIRIMQLNNLTPASLELSEIILPKEINQILGIYISETADNGSAKKITVISNINNADDELVFYQNNHIGVFAFDVSDPENPNMTWQMKVEGFYHASRSINNKLYLISSKYLNLKNQFDSNFILENESLINDLDIEDILPTTWLNQENINFVNAKNCMIPKTPNVTNSFEPSLLTVLTIPTDQPKDTQSFCTTESSGNVYVSPESIYFTKDEYLRSENRNNIGKTYTVIHKLSFTDDNVSYRSSIRLPGWAGWRNSAFRMSELDGNLRIILSNNEFVSNEENPAIGQLIEPLMPVFQGLNHKLYVLNESTEEIPQLEILSELPNENQTAKIGKPGEDIYAVRFIGTYAYIVTFRRTDPLYAINLKDPSAPFIEGELSIPGFSEYLHPINENLLLGIGKDADQDGIVKGLKATLFDISDKTEPKTLNEIVLGNRGSYTALSQDYKAFSILSDTATGLHRLAFPVSISNEKIMNNVNDFVYYNWSYSGLQLLQIDDGSISSTAEMKDSGTLISFERTKELKYHYPSQPRGILVDEAVHYIENAEVWSANWHSPEVVSGPN